jgi:hypothetical protein
MTKTPDWMGYGFLLIVEYEPDQEYSSFSVSLDPTEQKQHEKDHKHDPDKTTRPVAPVSAMRPTWNHADQQKNQDD